MSGQSDAEEDEKGNVSAERGAVFVHAEDGGTERECTVGVRAVGYQWWRAGAGILVVNFWRNSRHGILF